jgi:endo-1,4-beta-xylanase
MRTTYLPLWLAALALAACDQTGTEPPWPSEASVLPAIELSLEPGALVPGSSVRINAWLPDSGRGASVRFESLDPEVATVDSAGSVRGLTSGTTVIRATADALNGSLTVTVLPGGVLDASGGTLSAFGGRVVLAVPPGALSGPTAVSISRASRVASERIVAGSAFTLGPESLEFETPAQLSVAYGNIPLPRGVRSPQLLLFNVEPRWEQIGARGPNLSGEVIAGAVRGAGTFGILGPETALSTAAARHDIEIGAAVSHRAFRGDHRFRETLAHEFGSLTAENVMKFNRLQPSRGVFDFAAADALVDFARANGMHVHGHTLVWHESLPRWLEHGGFTRPELLAILRDHITHVVARYRGRIASWDVVNEAVADEGGGLRSSFWLREIGPEYVDSAFVWAHRADPEARLFYNDYGIEYPGGKTSRVHALLDGLLHRGTPIHGVGLQSHFMIGQAPSRDQMQRAMQLFAGLGLQVRVTELDVWLPDGYGASHLARQAEVYRDVAAACRGVPACEAITFWGFTDRYSWVPNFAPGFGDALPFDRDFRPKPAYHLFLAELMRP